MNIKWAVIALLLMSTRTCLQAAEVIIKNDGTKVIGELIGYDEASQSYLVQIGSFTKKVPEGEIQEIRDLGEGQPLPISNVPAKSNKAPDIQSLLSQVTNMKQDSPELQQLLQLQQASGSGNPLDPATLPPGMAAQLQGLQNGPGMGALFERFKDPAFQRTLLENLKKMRSALGDSATEGSDQQLQMIEGLFKKLNTAGGGQPTVNQGESGTPGLPNSASQPE